MLLHSGWVMNDEKHLFDGGLVRAPMIAKNILDLVANFFLSETRMLFMRNLLW